MYHNFIDLDLYNYLLIK